MKYQCSNGTTWDMAAFATVNDEFSMDEIIQENTYYYSDVITFEGGEVLEIPEIAAVSASTIAAPWE